MNKLELLSSTDKECLWKKHKQPVLEQFQAQPTKTFCCIKQKRLPDFSIEVQENIRKRLIECDGNTALAKHRYNICLWIIFMDKKIFSKYSKH